MLFNGRLLSFDTSPTRCLVDNFRGISYKKIQFLVYIQYSTVQYSTVQYSTVQYSTVQYSTVQYSTVQ